MGKGGDALSVSIPHTLNESALKRRKKAESEKVRANHCLEITAAELAKHNTKEDCWISIRGSV